MQFLNLGVSFRPTRHIQTKVAAGGAAAVGSVENVVIEYHDVTWFEFDGGTGDVASRDAKILVWLASPLCLIPPWSA